MNNKHICKLCMFSTDRLSHLERHKKTKKHLTNYNRLIKDSKKTHLGLINESSLKTKKKQILCRKCDKVQSSYSNRKRHEFKCKEENNKLKEENKKLKEKMSIMFNPSDLVSYINEGKINKDQPIHIHNNIINNNNTNKKTINLTGIKYAKEYYPRAPLLIYQNCKTSKKLFGNEKEQIEDKNNNKNNDSDSLELITEEEDDEDNEDNEDKAIRSFNDMEIEDLCEKENIKFVDNVKYYKDKNEMVKIFTNFIIRYYKKENKEEQSLHVIDASRKKFIYTKLEKNLNKIKWVEETKQK